MTITDTEIPCTVTFGGMRAEGKLSVTYEYARPEPDIGHHSPSFCLYNAMLDLTPEILFMLATALMSGEACINVTIRRAVPVGVKTENMSNGFLYLDEAVLQDEITGYLAELERAA